MKQDWQTVLSQPQYAVEVEKDVLIGVRDGVWLCANIFRPAVDGRFPALLSMSPYSKDVQSLPLPIGRFNLEYSTVEAGDTEYFVSRGYVHIIVDIRGTGKSGGEYPNMFSTKEAEDGYDVVEWIAQQAWCNGNVGMLGESYFAIIQYFVAALQPPHLKAIFAFDGWGDLYRDIAYHGGILGIGFMPYLWHLMVTRKAVPATKAAHSAEELERLVEKVKNHPVIEKSPYLYGCLIVPEKDPLTFDFLLNPIDGPFYWERSGYTKYDKIKIPAYLGSEWSKVSIHLPGAFSSYAGIKAPKKLILGPPGSSGRPFVQYHDIMLRWYDHWLKGIDTGIMDEPTVRIFVMGANEWRDENEWPLARTKWTKYYLRSENFLREALPTTGELPDSFEYKPALPIVINPVPLEDKVESLVYSTEILRHDVEVTGPIAIYLYASISSDDANWIVKLKDVGPDGSKVVFTRGWLKASHKELDKDKSQPWQPYHTHTSPAPVVPGDINEYAIELRPTSYVFKAGHKIELEIVGSDYPPEPNDQTYRWPIFNHLPNDKDTLYTIYHTPNYPSHLLLPII